MKFVHFIGWIVTIFLFVLSFAVWLFFYTLPTIESFDKTIKLATKQTIGRFENKHQTYKWIKISEVNRDLIYSVVFAEDGRFFEHNGVDADALLSAIFANIKYGKKSLGGSTITQQVVKNLYLTNEKSYLRKLQEIVLSLRMDRIYSKNEILEIYLNIAEFGIDLYGVERASGYYFNKSPKNVNVAEGAYMALMLPSPRKYQYVIHQNKNPSIDHKRKYKNILRDMYANGYINEQDYKKYLGLFI